MFLVSFWSSYRWNHHALARGPDPPSVIRSQCWPLWYWLMPPPWQLLQERDTKASSIGRCLAAERALRSLQGSFASLCHHLRPRRNEAACGCCCRSTSNEETTMVGAICTASFFSFSYVLLICSSVGSGSTRNRQLEEGFSSSIIVMVWYKPKNQILGIWCITSIHCCGISNTQYNIFVVTFRNLISRKITLFARVWRIIFLVFWNLLSTTYDFPRYVCCCILGKTWKGKMMMKYTYNSNKKKNLIYQNPISSLEYIKAFHMVHLASSSISKVKRTQIITTTRFLQPHSN